MCSDVKMKKKYHLMEICEISRLFFLNFPPLLISGIMVKLNIRKQLLDFFDILPRCHEIVSESFSENFCAINLSRNFLLLRVI